MKLDIHDVHLKEIVISDKSSIKDAIKSIQANSERVCFVVDRKKIMLSSISDGDVRRGLLKGYKLNDKVKRIQNKNFVCVAHQANLPTFLIVNTRAARGE